MKKSETYICKTAEEMMDLGAGVASRCNRGSVISLRGSLGAGKTVFTKGVALYLGIKDAIVSPTFTLVQEYKDGSLPMYHMDLYRIGTEEDFSLIGGEDLLYSDGICLIEWSEIIDDMLPDNTVFVEITVNADQSRTVVIGEGK